MTPSLVLASTSPYRRALLEGAGIAHTVVAPDFDERALDHELARLGAEALAIEIARGKARSVVVDDGTVVLAADQLAVLEQDDGSSRLLTKPGTTDRAVDQLVAMAGRTHRLVNGLVLRDPSTDSEWAMSDVHRVTMRPYDRDDAVAYVERFRPLDCVGAYRLEDDADLIESVDGSGRSGVIGLPLDAVRDLLELAGVTPPE
jgi:septum formation protein